MDHGAVDGLADEAVLQSERESSHATYGLHAHDITAELGKIHERLRALENQTGTCFMFFAFNSTFGIQNEYVSTPLLSYPELKSKAEDAILAFRQTAGDTGALNTKDQSAAEDKKDMPLDAESGMPPSSQGYHTLGVSAADSSRRYGSLEIRSAIEGETLGRLGFGDKERRRGQGKWNFSWMWEIQDVDEFFRGLRFKAARKITRRILNDVLREDGYTSSFDSSSFECVKDWWPWENRENFVNCSAKGWNVNKYRVVTKAAINYAWKRRQEYISSTEARGNVYGCMTENRGGQDDEKGSLGVVEPHPQHKVPSPPPPPSVHLQVAQPSALRPNFWYGSPLQPHPQHFAMAGHHQLLHQEHEPGHGGDLPVLGHHGQAYVYSDGVDVPSAEPVKALDRGEGDEDVRDLDHHHHQLQLHHQLHHHHAQVDPDEEVVLDDEVRSDGGEEGALDLQDGEDTLDDEKHKRTRGDDRDYHSHEDLGMEAMGAPRRKQRKT